MINFFWRWLRKLVLDEVGFEDLYVPMSTERLYIIVQHERSRAVHEV